MQEDAITKETSSVKLSFPHRKWRADSAYAKWSPSHLGIWKLRFQFKFTIKVPACCGRRVDLQGESHHSLNHL